MNKREMILHLANFYSPQERRAMKNNHPKAMVRFEKLRRLAVMIEEGFGSDYGFHFLIDDVLAQTRKKSEKEALEAFRARGEKRPAGSGIVTRRRRKGLWVAFDEMIGKLDLIVI